MIFEEFKVDIKSFFHGKNLDENNVAYVALDEKNWISWKYFEAFKEMPTIWHHQFEKEMFGTWSLPRGFKIVFNDYSWIEYNHCFDPYYSEFIYHKPLVRPANKYFEKIKYISRYKHNIVLGDFIHKKTNEKRISNASVQTELETMYYKATNSGSVFFSPSSNSKFEA